MYRPYEVRHILAVDKVTLKALIDGGLIPAIRLSPRIVRIPPFWENCVPWSIHPDQLQRWQTSALEFSFDPLDVLDLLAKLLTLRLDTNRVHERLEALGHKVKLQTRSKPEELPADEEKTAALLCWADDCIRELKQLKAKRPADGKYVTWREVWAERKKRKEAGHGRTEAAARVRGLRL